jgi:hypothetical protein
VVGGLLAILWQPSSNAYAPKHLECIHKLPLVSIHHVGKAGKEMVGTGRCVHEPKLSLQADDCGWRG